MESRAANTSGVWEVVGVLAAIIPCGILAGLYLATSDAKFLIVFALFAVAAAGIVFFRRPRRLAWTGWWRRAAGTDQPGKAEKAPGRLGAMHETLSRTLTARVVKLLGLVVWLMAWTVVAALYARVAQNTNIAALLVLVAVGGLSPVVIYFGLEASVKKLTKRLDDDK
jgi:hypothetical protein